MTTSVVWHWWPAGIVVRLGAVKAQPLARFWLPLPDDVGGSREGIDTEASRVAPAGTALENWKSVGGAVLAFGNSFHSAAVDV